ncbi:PP2C family protein-serine/threonine phosphatase [Kitasatospora cathayae]|uniref:PP2C family protein-serine/threonine phosphatase n=1 Tax=Kitasatospora cathayae TaxID=3004092 RepID=A0ABY7QEA1_9ACTN|nr:PP2C family protein-serine/threonine phosphatase [Kitasatospora sp. HUAS 3-15]WBP91025.1 PP2C family protein-serine/threonine phosphatase [Kitasatospora sp. HUAS 3-15]
MDIDAPGTIAAPAVPGFEGHGAAPRAPGNGAVALGVLVATALVLLAQAASGSGSRLVLLLVFLPALLAGLGTVAQTVAVSVWVTGVVVVHSALYPPSDPAARLGMLLGVVAAEAAVIGLCARRVRRERQLFRMRQSAVALQRQLLRPLPVRTAELDLFGLYRPVEEDTLVGGDLYDVAETPHGTRVLIGDVQGKGLGAIGTGFAVLSAFREAAFREAELTAVADALEAAVERHNAYAVQSGELERFVTATVLCVRRGGGVRAVDCGHLAPCLVRADGRVEPVALPGGVPLGLAALVGQPRAVGCFGLPEGGVLVLLTDGITEAQDAFGAFYPAERGLAELAGVPAAELPGALEGRARRWSGGRSRDDVTVLVLCRAP